MQEATSHDGIPLTRTVTSHLQPETTIHVHIHFMSVMSSQSNQVRKIHSIKYVTSSLFLYRLSRRNNESWPSFPFQGYSNSLSKKLSFKKSHNGCPLVVQVKCCISSRAAYKLTSVMRHKWREAKAQGSVREGQAPHASTPHHKLGCGQACSLSETRCTPLYKVVKVPPPRPPWLLLRDNPSP